MTHTHILHIHTDTHRRAHKLNTHKKTHIHTKLKTHIIKLIKNRKKCTTHTCIYYNAGCMWLRHQPQVAHVELQGKTHLLSVADGYWNYVRTCHTSYLKTTIVFEYYFFVIFAIGGKNANLSTFKYKFYTCKIATKTCKY